MNLSKILFSNLTNKFKLDTHSLIKKRSYIENLISQVNSLREMKEKNHKQLGVGNIENQHQNIDNYTDLTIVYIIDVSFSKANTMIHISDTKGNLKLFYSAGTVGLVGKQKRNRRIAIIKLISLLMKKATFVGKKPVALHLNNVNFYQNLIVNKLKQTIFIKVIKSFNQVPYNGCRKKKVRRKKYVKKFR